MKVAILTMFNGLSTTYSLVNVVSDQLNMLLDAGISVKLLVSEHCQETERWGVFLDERIEWVKIKNTLHGKQIQWYDYSIPVGVVHDTFFEETELIAEDFVTHLQDVDICIMHDILYQGWHLVHNVAIRKAQLKLPQLRFLAFTHSLPVNRPKEISAPFDARYTPMMPDIHQCQKQNLYILLILVFQLLQDNIIYQKGIVRWSIMLCHCWKP